MLFSKHHKQWYDYDLMRQWDGEAMKDLLWIKRENKSA